MNSEPSEYLAATFYRFVALQDREQLAQTIRRNCQANHITGTVLIAPEGINGTICGAAAEVTRFLDLLRSDPKFAGLEHKESVCTERPLKRLKVKLKPEIITMRAPDVDAAANAGQYVEPADWNALISRPDVVVIDTRNHYEVAIGTFRNALNPQTDHFSDLPAWIDQQADLQEKPPVAMFCTGGIRCEKSTALLKSRGFEHVYHLHGGILRYLEQVDEKDSLFDGECFVFDERVSVNHELQAGSYQMCPNCGYPLPQPATSGAADPAPVDHCPGCERPATDSHA